MAFFPGMIINVTFKSLSHNEGKKAQRFSPEMLQECCDSSSVAKSDLDILYKYSQFIFYTP